MRNRLFIIAFFAVTLPFFSLQAQSSDYRDVINEQTAFVNQLIEHLNVNLKKLRKYQDDLNDWAQGEQPELENAPFYSYQPFLLADDYQKIKAIAAANPPNGAFNHYEQLDKLYKQTLLFNQFCKELKNVTRMGSKVKYYEINIGVLQQIESMSEEWVDISYDFSLACSVSFGKIEMPILLESSRDVIAKSKNLIMAIRQNDKDLAKNYLNQLNEVIIATQSSSDHYNMVKEGGFLIGTYEARNYIKTILDRANHIAGFGEQFVQGTQDQQETDMVLINTIDAFNTSKIKSGCAAAYNEMVENSMKTFLHFTEEPQFFHVNNLAIQILEDEAIQTSILALDTLESKTDELPTQNLIASVDTTFVDSENLFDANDKTTLAGAKSSNLVILMDVSASMKQKGKLPILKNSIEYLVNIMRIKDRISLIAYSGEAEILISSAGIGQRGQIQMVLDTLSSSGGTDIENAMLMAFDLVKNTWLEDGNNRIIIASDGMFGVNSNLLNLIKVKAKEGITTSIFHFVEPKENRKSDQLNRISELGKGTYSLILDNDEAIDALVSEVKQAKP